MNERNLAEEFDRAWEAVSRQGESSPAGEGPEAVQQALDTARQVSRLDYSNESTIRESLRRRLQVEYAAAPQAERGKFNWTHGLAALGSLAGVIVLMACFVLGFSWLIRSFLPGAGPASPELPGAANLLPSGTPPATSPGTTSTPEALSAFVESPAPTVEALPPVLGLESLPDTIRWGMQNPAWKTVWLQGQARSKDEAGKWTTVYSQAWLGREGQGAAVLTEPLPGEEGFDLGLAPDWLWTSDGKGAQSFDLRDQNAEPAPGAWSMHPLEGASGLFEMVFPVDLPGDLNGLLPVEHTTWAGRPALVIEWDGMRYWVDEHTGLVLRRLKYGEDGEPLEDISLEAVVYNLAAPPAAWISGNLAEVSFEPVPTAPGSGGTATAPTLEAATPTPTPLLPPGTTPTPTSGEPIAITLADETASSLAGDEPAGELYFTLRSLAAPVERRLARLTVDCLLARDACEARRVRNGPPVGDQLLHWSPDGRRAALFDFNGNLWLYDPQGEVWTQTASDLTVTTDIAAWSPDGARIAFTTQPDGSQDSLITLAATETGLQVGRVETYADDLGGTQIPLGWQNENTLIFLQTVTPPKGAASPEVAPGLFRLDIRSGEAGELSLNRRWNWLSDYPAVSPDGARLAFSILEGTGSQLVIYDLGSDATDPLGIAGVRPAWSPDGKRLAFLNPWMADSGPMVDVNVIEADGSGLQKVFEWGTAPPVEWSPDGAHLLVAAGPPGDEPPDDRATFYLISVEDGMARRLVMEGEPEEYEFIAPSWRELKN